MTLGELKKTREKDGRHFAYHVWEECVLCKEPRWTVCHKDPTDGFRLNGICRICQLKAIHKSGEAHPNFKGGRWITDKGYTKVLVSENSPFSPMRMHGGYVFEHRLVMAHSLNRCLKPWEVVHHKNGIKSDNQLENLELVYDSQHKSITLLEQRVKELEELVVILANLNIPSGQAPRLYMR